MHSPQTFKIDTDYDVVFVRKQVREVARTAGMDTANQARVSLGVSALAQKLGLGAGLEGKIILEVIETEPDRVGIQITLVCAPGVDCTPVTRDIHRARWMYMVDDLSVSVQPDGVTRVIALKWGELAKGQAHV
jgi:hypothetical protein